MDKGIIFSAAMVNALLGGRKTQTRRLLNPQPPTTEAVRALSGSDYHWFARKPGDREMSVAGPVWAVRELTGQGNPKIKVPYAVGDRLYVREAHSIRGVYTDVVEVGYRASERRSHTEFVEQVPVGLAIDAKGRGPKVTWPSYRPSIHMPRWASRLWLSVTDVRVQRVGKITSDDALAEGVDPRAHVLERYQGEWRGDGECVRSVETRTYVPAFRDLWNSLHTAPGERWEDNPWIVAVTFEVNRGNIDAVTA